MGGLSELFKKSFEIGQKIIPKSKQRNSIIVKYFLQKMKIMTF